ncbi:MAG: hypothetical protein C7N36_14810 [Bacteroidetes bacterium]|nr:MAG: hypothetical protein C7N36_14810 [Bacteroidota bacterium]
MVATQTALTSFLTQNRTQFVIPVYQRNYDWTETQCRQLLDDILEVGQQPEGETHFIGSIVFIHDGIYTSTEVKPLVVIDGQQRLTTLSLLYLAIRNFALQHDKVEKANEIYETILFNKYVKEDSSKLKLKQTDNNSQAFLYLLEGHDAEAYGEYSRVIENYKFFMHRLNEGSFEAILNGLERLLFVEISLERGKDDPQRIFESLNSTGLELSQADLIRNYILMGLPPDEQIRVFNTYWQVIEKNAQLEEQKESRVSAFIRDFLTVKTKKIPTKGKVYESFKTLYKKRDQTFYTDTLAALKQYSFHYNKLLNPDKEKNAAIALELRHIDQIEINTAFPFLIPVYDDYANGLIDQATFLEVLRLIQSFTWRRFILALPTNALNKIFMTLYSDLDSSSYVASLERSLVKKKGAGRFPNNEEIKAALKEKDVYNIRSKNRNYFFSRLENHNNREYVATENPKITVEHIFPQKPDARWREQLDADEIGLMQNKYLHTLANLTLSGNNGNLGNKSFQEKKQMNVNEGEQGYRYSRLWLNSYLSKIEDWGVLQVDQRFEQLLQRFYEIWQYPAIDQLFDEETEELYTILDAPDSRHKKLEYFIFQEEKVITDEVAKMYYHVIGSLFEERPSLFLSSDLKDMVGVSSNPESLRAPYKISDAYYLESNIDNTSKFRRLRLVLEKFDRVDELTFRYAVG